MAWWQVADFSKGVLSSCTANDVVPSLHLLGFLQEVGHTRRTLDWRVGC